MAFVKWGMEGLKYMNVKVAPWSIIHSSHPCWPDQTQFYSTQNFQGMVLETRVGEMKVYTLGKRNSIVCMYLFLKDMWLISGWDLGNLPSYSWITANLETCQVSVIKSDQGNSPSPMMSQYWKRADTNKRRHNAQMHRYIHPPSTHRVCWDWG